METYKLTLTNSLNCDYTATFKVINIDTPEITALRGQNDYYDVIATGIAGKNSLFYGYDQLSESNVLEIWNLAIIIFM